MQKISKKYAKNMQKYAQYSKQYAKNKICSLCKSCHQYASAKYAQGTLLMGLRGRRGRSTVGSGTESPSPWLSDCTSSRNDHQCDSSLKLITWNWNWSWSSKFQLSSHAAVVLHCTSRAVRPPSRWRPRWLGPRQTFNSVSWAPRCLANLKPEWRARRRRRRLPTRTPGAALASVQDNFKFQIAWMMSLGYTHFSEKPGLGPVAALQVTALAI